VALISAIGLLGSCAADAPPDDLIAVPTQSQPPLIDVGPVACPQALVEGELVADDEVGFVVEAGDFSTTVIWPHGFVARDAERRELLDGSGRVIAREGDHVALGGGDSGVLPGFVVCGQLDVTPAPGS
jgi:hypothetical protein